MSFGLKVAPSLFQKAMVRIFEPILHSALIYIDDILLFSKDSSTHKQLLAQFHSLVQHYGIMSSEKKSYLAQTDIEFLGMKFCTLSLDFGPSYGFGNSEAYYRPRGLYASPSTSASLTCGIRSRQN